jgi:hypothetical protein
VKTFIFALFLVVLLAIQAQAKTNRLPPVPGQDDLLEEWGLTEHVDPFQYNRLQKGKVLKQKAIVAAAAKRAGPLSIPEKDLVTVSLKQEMARKEGSSQTAMKMDKKNSRRKVASTGSAE